jgi:hypothetical protein
MRKGRSGGPLVNLVSCMANPALTKSPAGRCLAWKATTLKQCKALPVRGADDASRAAHDPVKVPADRPVELP